MKINKWWIFGLGLVALIAMAIFLGEVYLKKRIQEEFQIQTIHGDTLQVSSVDLGLLRGWVDFNDLVIRWNIGTRDTSRKSSTYLVQGEIGKVQLKGLSFSQYLFNDRIRIKKLLIDSSTLDLHLLDLIPETETLAPDTSAKSENDLVINIQGIEIAPSRIRYFVKEEKEPRFQVEAMSLEVQEFCYPQPSDSSNFINHFNWEARELRYSRSEQFSDLLVARSSGSSNDSSLHFSHLHFRPRYSKAEYSQYLKHKDSRVDVVVKNGKMQGLDWFSLLTKENLVAKKFFLDSCLIEIYEDSRLPVDETRYKSLYPEKLLQATIGISVDTVQFTQGELTYEMRPDKPDPTLGYLKFLDLNATIANITNDSDRIATQPLLRTKVNTRVNGESELKAYFTFDLSDPNYAYSYSGDMHGFDLTQFNTILMETSKMKIAEGKMQHLAFQVEADKQLSQGEMRIDYSGLKIEWQEEHNKLAALAQKVLMREQNPKNDNYRVGQIYHIREPYRSFWNSYLKSLLSGLNSTAMPNLFLPKELDAKKEKM